MFHGEFKLKTTDILLKNRGLHDIGSVQKFIDEECIKRMKKYTPHQMGVLERNPILNTRIGSGRIYQEGPYARYQYYGKLMISASTGSAYAKKYEKKILTNKDLHYNGEPQRGPFWFMRMAEDCKEDILKGAQAVANKGG